MSSNRSMDKQQSKNNNGTEIEPLEIMQGDNDDNDGAVSSRQDSLLENEAPSNERLLLTAFVSFMSFALLQTAAAIYAGSEAMMGDSAAMIVDALTYLFNLIAERQKSTFNNEYLSSTLSEQEKQIRLRNNQKKLLQLELIPPLISVSTLLVVTGFVSHNAIKVLLLDMHRDESEQADPNLNLMLLFSFLNLCLDGINVFCFASAKHLFGYDTNTDHGHEKAQRSNSLRPLISEHGGNDDDDSNNSDDSQEQLLPVSSSTTTTTTIAQQESSTRKAITPMEIDDGDDVDIDNDEQQQTDGANLNMCSAYTHVFADTLRSIAVIVSAGVAELVDSVTPEEADATAALIVSFLILLSLIPLFSGICTTFSALWEIRTIERQERLMKNNTSNNR